MTGLTLLVVIGAGMGFVARAVVPGRQELSGRVTVLIGIVGSVLAGTFANSVAGHVGGITVVGTVSALAGSIVVLLIYMAFGKRRAGER